MKSPYVIHPNKFCIDGFVFKVVSSSVLSEAQAANAAVHFCKTNQLYKHSKKEIHTVDMTIAENSRGL
ncbi:MAG: hypothetical protein HQ515_04320 [Phycisphaeraceae bacterium]|nr:hypothetical protein [Phycisphaeraceae bacterium]